MRVAIRSLFTSLQRSSQRQEKARVSNRGWTVRAQQADLLVEEVKSMAAPPR